MFSHIVILWADPAQPDAADKIVAELAPVIRSEHPDWSSPEWIDFAIRYYASFD